MDGRVAGGLDARVPGAVHCIHNERQDHGNRPILPAEAPRPQPWFLTTCRYQLIPVSFTRMNLIRSFTTSEKAKA